jgi:hypothetical protein
MNGNLGTTAHGQDPLKKIGSMIADDYWEGCKNAYCRGYSGSVPENAIPVMDESQYKCWWWSCVNGFTQENNKCNCVGKNTYVTKNAQGITICAKCEGENTYITKDAQGITICATCDAPYILKDGKCIEKPKPVKKPDDKKPGETTDNRNECEKGIAGYVIFEGVCMKTDDKAVIEKQREEARVAKEKADKISVLQASISVSASASKEIESKYSIGKKSVWKNADGKFNTSRLTSDSVAGVVLGAAGGLITHSVVKKNQIKKGMEDIACFVSDLKVADFGDEFTIGLK